MDGICIVSTEKRRERVDIRTVRGMIEYGWLVLVQLSLGKRVISWKAVNLCETSLQSAGWCEQQCEAFMAQLGDAPAIEQLISLGCPREVIGNLGVPVPPEQPFWTERQALAYNARTGKPGTDGYEAVRAAFVVEYNAWIAANPAMATALHCTPQ